jgi:hypothetical protein
VGLGILICDLYETVIMIHCSVVKWWTCQCILCSAGM